MHTEQTPMILSEKVCEKTISEKYWMLDHTLGLTMKSMCRSVRNFLKVSTATGGRTTTFSLLDTRDSSIPVKIGLSAVTFLMRVVASVATTLPVS